MLKKQNIQIFERKKCESQNTIGEVVRDSIIDYAAGNKTEVMVELAQKARSAVDGGIVLACGTESASAIG